jgi:predicted RecB family nuclease
LPGPIVFKDELRALRSQLGNRHEEAWIKRLAALGVRVVEVGQKGLDEEREELTRLAMREGAEAIHGGRISDGRWAGEPDLLLRKDVIRRLTGHQVVDSAGAHRYEAADVKLSVELTIPALLQVSLYAELIDAIQGIEVTDRRDHQMHFFLGAADEELDGPVVTTAPKGMRSLSVAAFGAYTRRHMRRVEVAWDT